MSWSRSATARPWTARTGCEIPTVSFTCGRLQKSSHCSLTVLMLSPLRWLSPSAAVASTSRATWATPSPIFAVPIAPPRLRRWPTCAVAGSTSAIPKAHSIARRRCGGSRKSCTSSSITSSAASSSSITTSSISHAKSLRMCGAARAAPAAICFPAGDAARLFLRSSAFSSACRTSTRSPTSSFSVAF